MFLKKIDERIRVILFIICICFILIIFRVIFVQTVTYKKLYNLADDLWSRELPITAERGRILDRNGNVLADNITSTPLYVIPSQIKDYEETARIISETINANYDDIYKHITKSVSIERIHPEGRRLKSDIADKIASYNLPGVYLIKESERYYPYDELLSHVLGYVGIDNQGLAGVELLYDKYLTGTNGALKYYSDAKGNKLNMNEVYIESVSGMDIMLTIDLDIQKSVERELDNIVTMFEPDNAYVLAMNPNTGEILAMSSRPTYNPNKYKEYSQEVLNRNLPIWKTYEPGSTFKNVTLLFSNFI